MFKELEQFNAVTEKVNGKLFDLQQEKQQKEAEKGESDRAYRQMLNDDTMGEAKHTTAEITKSKRKSEDLDRDIRDVQDRIDVIIMGRDEKLKDLVPALKNGRDREVGSAVDEMRVKMEELREYRAQYMLKVKEIHDAKRRVREIDSEFKSAARLITNEYDREFVHYPATNLFDTTSGDDKALGILQREVDQVISTGILPPWIQYYAETGKVVYNNHVYAERPQMA
jgi:acylphosphatase